MPPTLTAPLAPPVPADPDASKVPRHVAVIMDGNGRWARERGLPRIKGHEEGSKSAGAVVQACADAGVQYLTLYAFSAENWRRPAAEVSALMKLLERFLREKTPEMIKNGVRLRAIGHLADLPAACRKQIALSMEATGNGQALTLILALSYGGRNEIIDAVRRLATQAAAGEINPAEIDEAVFSGTLDTADYPDPDLLIRTSGEMRLSNFLLWQLSYTEIYVTRKLWPDFREAELHEALRDYAQRSRRFGAI